MKVRLKCDASDFCCDRMKQAFSSEYVHIDCRLHNVRMGNIGEVKYCPYCGDRIEIKNDIP